MNEQKTHMPGSLLPNSEDWLLRLLDVCPIGLLLACNRNNECVYFNKIAADLLHIRKDSREKISIKSLLDALAGVDQNGEPLKCEDYPLWLSLHGTGERSLVFSKTTQNNTSILLMKSSFVKVNEEINYVITTIEDITKPTHLYENLQVATLRLENLWAVSSNAAITMQNVCNITLETIVSITQSEYGFYGFIGDHEKNMMVQAWSSKAMANCSVHDKQLVYSIDQAGIWAEAIRQRRPIIVNDYEATNLCKKGYPEGHVAITRIMTIPYFIEHKIHSLISVANKRFNYTQNDINTTINFLNDIYLVIKRLEVEEQLKKSHKECLQLATIDHLTGLYNRRFLFDNLSKEISLAERHKESMSIILFDLDFFKKVNDTHGHNIGDAVLQDIANCLFPLLRATDTAYRFGGEEFLLVLPKTMPEQAAVIADRIRSTIEKKRLQYEGVTITVTASFGVSGYHGQGAHRYIGQKCTNELLNQADQALYQAKREGRNTVRLAPGPLPPTKTRP